MKSYMGWSELKALARITLLDYIKESEEYPFDWRDAGEVKSIRQWESGRRLLLGFFEGEEFLEIDMADNKTPRYFRLTSKGYAFALRTPLEEFVEKYKHQIWYDVLKTITATVLPSFLVGASFSLAWHLVRKLMGF